MLSGDQMKGRFDPNGGRSNPPVASMLFLLAIRIHHHQLLGFAQKSNLFAVGRKLWLRIGFAAFGELFFLSRGEIVKE